LRLTGYRYGNHRAGAFVEDIMAKNKNGADAGMFPPPNWIQVGPTDFTL
jgi:hypothetical protein